MYLLLTLNGQVADWNLVNEDGILKLRRSWKVKTFTKGLEFFGIIADLAEAEGIIFWFFAPRHQSPPIDVMGEIESLTMMFYNVGHHPDLHLVGWNNVTIEIWTHSVGMNISLFKYLIKVGF